MTWAAPWLPTKLLKCAEFIDECGGPITDGCCGIVPCSYCLEFVVYGEATRYGYAPVSTTNWTGEIANATFVLDWRRDPYTDECEVFVTLDGVEVYSKSCYEGASCRDSSDEAEVTIGYDTGTLIWTRREQRPLALVTDYETNCKRHFCGTCDCTCKCLCITIRDEYTEEFIINGELCDSAYECDGPIWQGQIGDYYIVLTLEDQNGGCVVTATVDGAEKGGISLLACSNISGRITIGDGNVIDVSCKVCDCEEEPPCISCCGGVYPQTTLYATFTLLNVTPMCACLDGLVITLTYMGWITNQLGECEAYWEGRASTTCPAYDQLFVRFVCAGSLDGVDGGRLEIYSDTGPGTSQTDFINGEIDYYFSDCDPFEYCIRSEFGWARSCGDASVDETQPEIEICVSL